MMLMGLAGMNASYAESAAERTEVSQTRNETADNDSWDWDDFDWGNDPDFGSEIDQHMADVYLGGD